MLHTGACAPCDGHGVVAAATGEALLPLEAAAFFRDVLQRRTAIMRRMLRTPGVREAMEAHQAKPSRDIGELVYPPGCRPGD